MNTDKLKKLWVSVADGYADHDAEWEEIEAAYYEAARHYHTHDHLMGLYAELTAYYEDRIPTATVFALFYHDMIYSTLRGDNEARSAERAREWLSSVHADTSLINKTCDIILATAKHESDDTEVKVFLDADMAVLGADASQYAAYTDAVRKEFSIYPDILYKRGRRKFVTATLNRDRVFLTEAFQKKYEAQARINLTNELNQLT